MNPIPSVAALLFLAPALAAQRPAPAGAEAAAAGGAPERRELAGRSLGKPPYFDFARSFNAGSTVEIAIDVLRDPRLAKEVVDVFVVEHAELGEFLAGRKLSSVLGPPLSVRLARGDVRENTFVLDAGSLRAETGTTALGHGYDVIVDVDSNARVDGEDLVDGGEEEAGFYLVEDFVTLTDGTQETGPYSVVELLYNGGSQFLREDVYYPANVAELGLLPLVVVSHGNGHNYTWYDHIGFHLASWGYVVMSHTNNTGPGPETAATTTLRNTNHFLANLETIAGGALDGHVDGERIVWIGHSRGGEGVVRAYRRLLEGDPIATRYGPEDVRLVSSIAPVDFFGPTRTDVGPVAFSLWTGGADADVNGCADCDLCQTFHLYERADGERFSISLHGVGHGDFHDGGGSSVANGPCQVGRPDTHRVMRGYLLPLIQYVLDGNPACKDHLWRQWEAFQPLGAPDGPCVVVDLMYQPVSEKLVIDDFQTNPSPFVSSSGGAVEFSFADLVESRLDDANGTFNAGVDPMNGMTLAGVGDVSRGIAFEWNGTDEFLLFELPEGKRDLRAYEYLSFRAAQATRDALTDEELGDLVFAVGLVDAQRRASLLSIGAYGGGIEEPYQRPGCGGTGRGWANEFETVRVRLADLLANGNPIDLSDVAAVSFRFGPLHGSAQGRIGLDELELTQE